MERGNHTGIGTFADNPTVVRDGQRHPAIVMVSSNRPFATQPGDRPQYSRIL